MNKLPYYQYPMVIYPRTLYVANSDDVSLLNKYFAFCTTDDRHREQESAFDSVYDSFENSVVGITCPVMCRKNGEYGVLVIINPDYLLDFDTISHESVHAADYVFEELGMNSEDYSCGNEHFAYLVGWIAGKIGTTFIKEKCK